ncbi:MAG: 50S ribosomal protein L19 [Candidatus Magasanikbacteria bacterium GW2011_GWC2_37_14]|uniref:50S ribosomal protein L19 n=1 Tax=Candidatus Magasanikbacteria bacterium GW2011_GWC2_37_14 TaxID=1619046 RepID=A0A0G0IUF5_9BACT|nr:MAG: 50S ribosomal protein L19 [Candidatus Magasanikbacteria bacterium GW2011_GWC2_37_14]
MNEDNRTNLAPGMIIKVHQKIKETNTKGEEKERIQVFEGMVIAVKHGKEPGATVTVRKISNSVGVEKIFPIHSPVVEKIEVVRQVKVRQARPYYLRDYKKKLKEIKGNKVEKVDNEILKNKKEIEPVDILPEVIEEKVVEETKE